MKYLFTFTIILAALAAPKDSLAFDHSHKLLNEVLEQYITVDGARSTVDYSSLKADVGKLQAYLTEVSAVSKPEFDKFSELEKLSFLINAYNAFTLQLIVDKYPVKSIKDIGSIFSSPWKKKFFKLFGQKSHLDEIEHKMIRVWFDEPRIHFALVCAAVSCPMLSSRAYTADKLESQLENASIKFLNDRGRNSFQNGTLYLSKIFKWYGEDFDRGGGVKKFVSLRISADPVVQQQIAADSTKVKYNDYDWGLNELLQ